MKPRHLLDAEELGSTDPGRLAAELARRAGDDDAGREPETPGPRPDPMPEGSIGRWIDGGGLDGLRLVSGGWTLTVRWAVCRWARSSLRGEWTCWAATLWDVDGPGRRRVLHELEVRDDLASLPFGGEGPVHDVLQGWLAEVAADRVPEGEPGDRMRWILHAGLAEVPEDGWIRWLVRDGVGWITGGEPLAHAVTARGDRWLSLDRLFVEGGPLPTVMARWVVWAERDGARIPEDVVERAAWWSTRDDWRPVPDLHHPHALAARDAWRRVIAARGARVLAEGSLVADDLLPSVLLQAMVETWIADGPPGPRPVWTSLDPDRPLRDGERLDPVPDDDPHVVAAFAIAGWKVRLAPYLNQPGGFWADTISIVSPEGEVAIVAMNDPWNPPAWGTVDGDPLRFRAFSDWLIAALQATGQDRDLHYLPDDPDDDEEEPRTEPLSRWLLCYDGYREHQAGELLYDWRLQPDRVSEWRFQDNGIYGLSEEERDQYARGAALWHRFLDQIVARPTTHLGSPGPAGRP